MRLMIKENVYGWIMTGLLGKKAKWFLGFSKEPNKFYKSASGSYQYEKTVTLEKEQCINLLKFAEENLTEKCDVVCIDEYCDALCCGLYISKNNEKKSVHLEGYNVDCI